MSSRANKPATSEQIAAARAAIAAGEKNTYNKNSKQNRGAFGFARR